MLQLAAAVCPLITEEGVNAAVAGAIRIELETRASRMDRSP